MEDKQDDSFRPAVSSEVSTKEEVFFVALAEKNVSKGAKNIKKKDYHAKKKVITLFAITYVVVGRVVAT